MAFRNPHHNVGAGSSSSHPFHFSAGPQPAGHAYTTSRRSVLAASPSAGEPFDILEWYPCYQSCQKYFLDYAQHQRGVQALAAFVNIKLPYQRAPCPVTSATAHSPHENMSAHLRGTSSPLYSQQTNAQAQGTSLIPYIRRLVVTGHDTPSVLHGFFGDDWKKGVGPSHEMERRNFMFAAKSESWNKVKEAYDIAPEELVPFLSPLKLATEEEIAAAERSWSEWLAMQDWMMGPRAPVDEHDPFGRASGAPMPVKRESMED